MYVIVPESRRASLAGAAGLKSADFGVAIGDEELESDRLSLDLTRS